MRWCQLTLATEVNSTWNRFDNATLERGDTLLHHEGIAYNATDGLIAWERAKAAVHIVTMAFDYSDSRFEKREGESPMVLCRIVEKPTKDLFVEEEGAAATVWQQSTVGVLGMALLGAIVMVW